MREEGKHSCTGAPCWLLSQPGDHQPVGRPVQLAGWREQSGKTTSCPSPPTAGKAIMIQSRTVDPPPKPTGDWPGPAEARRIRRYRNHLAKPIQPQ